MHTLIDNRLNRHRMQETVTETTPPRDQIRERIQQIRLTTESPIDQDHVLLPFLLNAQKFKNNLIITKISANQFQTFIQKETILFKITTSALTPRISREYPMSL